MGPGPPNPRANARHRGSNYLRTNLSPEMSTHRQYRLSRSRLEIKRDWQELVIERAKRNAAGRQAVRNVITRCCQHLSSGPSKLGVPPATYTATPSSQ